MTGGAAALWRRRKRGAPRRWARDVEAEGQVKKEATRRLSAGILWLGLEDVLPGVAVEIGRAHV